MNCGKLVPVMFGVIVPLRRPSVALGVGNHFMTACADSISPPPVPFPRGPPLCEFASGVGNNEDSPASMRGTKGCCRDAIPFRIVPERGQVPENSSKSPNSERIDIFHDDVSRS
jgi:hypothetical protein